MQDGKIEISLCDIMINLLYVVGVYLVFDYYLFEIICNIGECKNYIIELDVLLVVCVVYNYYGGKEVFLIVVDDMMEVVDKSDLV